MSSYTGLESKLREFWTKWGQLMGFKFQAEECVLDLVGHVGSLEGFYSEKRSRRKINLGALAGYKDLVAAIWL